MDKPIRLTRRDGGYVAEAGRFVVEPVTIGAGVNGNGGWSPGHREWRLTVTERTSFRRFSEPAASVLCLRLYEVRDAIAHVLRREQAKEG